MGVLCESCDGSRDYPEVSTYRRVRLSSTFIPFKVSNHRADYGAK